MMITQASTFPNCADPISNVLTIIVQPDATVNVTPIHKMKYVLEELAY